MHDQSAKQGRKSMTTASKVEEAVGDLKTRKNSRAKFGGPPTTPVDLRGAAGASGILENNDPETILDGERQSFDRRVPTPRDRTMKTKDDGAAENPVRETAELLSAALRFVEAAVRRASWSRAGAAVAAGLVMRWLDFWPSMGTALLVVGATFAAARLFQPLDAWYQKKLGIEAPGRL